MEFRYGMKYRGFSPGCQPMNGFVERIDSDEYYDELAYDRELTVDELIEYELVPIIEAGADS